MLLLIVFSKMYHRRISQMSLLELVQLCVFDIPLLCIYAHRQTPQNTRRDQMSQTPNHERLHFNNASRGRTRSIASSSKSEMSIQEAPDLEKYDHVR